MWMQLLSSCTISECSYTNKPYILHVFDQIKIQLGKITVCAPEAALEFSRLTPPLSWFISKLQITLHFRD